MPPLDSASAPDVREVLAEYDIGQLLAAEPLPAGHSANRKLTTSTGTYVLKVGYRPADVELQAEIAPLLTARGLRQARVVPTAGGGLVTRAGYCLLEFLPGSIVMDPTPAQVTAAMHHIAGYHRALGELPVSYQPDPGSPWLRTADPDFLLAELPGLLDRYGLADRETEIALSCLERARAGLAALPRQVVHGDVGPDNVLMNGNEVVSLIDFTPYEESVLFATSGALYWYHIFAVARVSAELLRASMRALGERRPWTAAELDLWPAGLVREALRRLATPLELTRRSLAALAPAAGPRKAAVTALVRVLPELSARLG